MLEAVEADVHLVGTLLSLNKAMPETTKETARAVVRKVVEDLEKRLASGTRATLTGALDRSTRISRPRHHDIDWNRTIAANLKHYLPEIPHGLRCPNGWSATGVPSQSVKKEVVLCIDQSGSMARPSSTPPCSVPSSRRCGPSRPGSSSSTRPSSI